jgi:uncharacterized protein (DUF924 family)
LSLPLTLPLLSQDLTPRQHFVKDLELDQQIATRFTAPLNELFQLQSHEQFLESPQTSLAAVILFDQFPRNIYRNQQNSFAYDSKALAIASEAIALNYHQELEEKQRGFLLMPFMHSEALEMQNKSVELFSFDAQFRDYAIKHRDVIERFGRFPHRNAIVDRPSTAEELEFLTQDGSSF